MKEQPSLSLQLHDILSIAPAFFLTLTGIFIKLMLLCRSSCNSVGQAQWWTDCMTWQWKSFQSWFIRVRICAHENRGAFSRFFIFFSLIFILFLSFPFSLSFWLSLIKVRQVFYKKEKKEKSVDSIQSFEFWQQHNSPSPDSYPPVGPE